MNSWLVPVVGGILGTLGTLTLALIWSQIQDWRRRREHLEALRELDRIANERATIPGGTNVFRSSGEATHRLPQWLERVPQVGDLGALLAQSGLPWTVRGFFLRSLAPALIVTVVLAILTGNALLAVVVGGTVATLPLLYVRRKMAQRRRRIEEQLPGAIDLLSRVMRAGQPLSGGLRMVAQESPEPIATEFRAVFEEQRFGLPFEEALLGFADRAELMDVRILVTAILVQREVGGNLTEILDKIAITMRSRFRVRRQVMIHTAQGRMSGYVLAALPIIVGSILALINREYMAMLITDGRAKVLLGVAATLQIMGFLWIRKIVDIKY